MIIDDGCSEQFMCIRHVDEGSRIDEEFEENE